MRRALEGYDERVNGLNTNLCLLLNFASTWAMVGLIWLIQIVHYPLFVKVGEQQFKEYSEDHQRLITYVVLPLMFVELGTAVLLWFSRPDGVSDAWVIAGLALVLLIWGSTFLIQVPQHSNGVSVADICDGALRHAMCKIVTVHGLRP